MIDDAKMHRVDNFNSMIVRLKEGRYLALSNPSLLFQFYDSPIKSVREHLHRPRGEEFQFYDSPIKSESDGLIAKTNINFNSMIVRLKGSITFW